MKPWIEAIHAYVPGSSKAADGRELVKLSANENPLGTSEAALAARAQASGPDRYPDPDSAQLRAMIGEVHGIDPARIVCGTGSDELLNLAAQAFAGPDDEIIYVRYASPSMTSPRGVAGRLLSSRPTAISAPMSMRCSDV